MKNILKLILVLIIAFIIAVIIDKLIQLGIIPYETIIYIAMLPFLSVMVLYSSLSIEKLLKDNSKDNSMANDYRIKTENEEDKDIVHFIKDDAVISGKIIKDRRWKEEKED